MAFSIGQWVVCVDDRLDTEWHDPMRFFYVGDLDGLRRGYVYTVRAAGRDEWDGAPGLWLVEIVRSICGDLTEEPGFAAARFRPLDEARLTIFRAMLNPTPEHEPA